MIRSFFPAIRSRIWASSAAPAAPVSLKPAEMMTAPSTFASMHSPMMPGTVTAGSGDHREINMRRHVGQPWIGGLSENNCPLRVDRKYPAAERAAEQIRHQRSPDAARGLRRANHRDVPRPHEHLERPQARAQQIMGWFKKVLNRHREASCVEIDLSCKRRSLEFRLQPAAYC